MKKRTLELYNESDLRSLRKRIALWVIAAALAGAAALGYCIFNCVRLRPSIANALLIKTIIASTAGGWIVISLVHFVIAELRNGIRHTEAMLAGEREEVCGAFTVSPEKLYIKNGVPLQTVRVDGDGGSSHINIASDKAARFSQIRTEKVYCVHGFIVACEVDDENR